MVFGTPKVSAQTSVDLGLSYATATGLTTRDVRVVVARVIQVFLGLLGILAVGLILYAGYLWMTSKGNEEMITKARQILTNAVIGLAIILSAFAIVSFVISRLVSATLGLGETAGLPGANGFVGLGVGSSNLESHYPPRDASGIPRNTKIVITFKVPIAPSTIINTNNVELFPTATPSVKITGDKLKVTATADNKTFVFKPVDLLGSSSAPTGYTAVLHNGILTGQGAAVFGATGTDYSWRFEVSTVIDLTPPYVVSVVPEDGATEPRNTVVEITFNEAIDPTTVTGSSAKFGVSQGATALTGTRAVSNGYRTVEFVTDQSCGTNSCGQTMYCLPGPASLTAKATAASLKPGVTPPETVDLVDGVVDLADNSLDGDHDGIAEGPVADSYSWLFNTTDAIDRVPPTVSQMKPLPGASGVSAQAPMSAVFSKLVRSSSITTTSFKLLFGTQIFPGNFAVGVRDSHQEAFLQTFAPYLEVGKVYAPQLSSNIQDTRQNCYYPCSAGGTACTGASWRPSYPSCRL